MHFRAAKDECNVPTSCLKLSCLRFAGILPRPQDNEGFSKKSTHDYTREIVWVAGEELMVEVADGPFCTNLCHANGRTNECSWVHDGAAGRLSDIPSIVYATTTAFRCDCHVNRSSKVETQRWLKTKNKYLDGALV